MGPKSYQIICGTKYRYWTRSRGPTGPKTSSIIYCTNEAIKKWKYAMKNKQLWLLETKCQQKIWLNLRQQIGQNTTHSGYGPKSWKLWLWFEGCECENPEKNTDNVIKSHKCNQCNYTSAQACHLRHHLKTHSGEKPNKCNQCDYASSQKSTLRRHLLTHSGEKSNKCNQCDYTSSHAGVLRRHLKTHSGEKANKCYQCNYASSEAGNLRRHLQTHSGEKSNNCNQCDYASSQVSDLRRHLKTHSGEKANKWIQCDYPSSQAI